MIFKIVIIGDSSVGKTGLLCRYLNNEFNEQTKATVGVEFGTKKLEIQDHKIKVQIWDTAGQERYRSITNAYYKGAKGALIVYDISKKSSFDSVERWAKEVKIMGDADMYLILVGNKADLNDSREVSSEEGQQKAKSLGIAFIETSAKIAYNIDRAFMEISKNIVSAIISKRAENEDVDDLIIERKSVLELSNGNKEKKIKKCC